ncbi:MAG: 50S ribosomal protein L24 [Chloroflexota bacterium]
MRIRSGDEVEVITGKDRGKRGTVQEVMPSEQKVVVAGVNIAKRHTKPNPQRNVKGGIVEQPMAMDVSKVMLVCPHCGRPTRVAHRSDDGDKERVCKRCGETIVAEKEK